MWVNISDSLLSVFLVWFFVPRLGIIGYAAAIIIMEAYNFLLSLARLIKRVKFSINIFHSAVYPALAAGVSAYLTKSAFISLGAGISAFLLICEIVFCVCMFVGVYKIMMLGEEFLKQKINQ
jgi:O-antigen/teichoic acid export membrane protein